MLNEFLVSDLFALSAFLSEVFPFPLFHFYISPLFAFRLKSLFYRSSNLQYFKRLIQIPQLPEVRTYAHLNHT